MNWVYIFSQERTNMIQTNEMLASIFTASLKNISSQNLEFYRNTKTLKKFPKQLVTATLEVHKFIVDNLLPTPDHSHYLFSLKEFSR